MKRNISEVKGMDEFRKLGISEDILRSLSEMNFVKPTEVQIKAIPFALEGKDVIVGSETGSGKTLAFGAAILQHALRGKGIQALILTPTRELAEQIQVALKNFSKYAPLNITAVYGGVSINPQFKALEKADIVVGTPGRILDHLERRTINLAAVKFLVLDEADRMLDMGFLDDVKKIMSRCGKEKQTSLFSATISSDITELAKRFMNAPMKITAGTQVDPKKLHQVYYDVKSPMKFSLLVHLMKSENTGLVMVFCNSRKYTDVVAKNLYKNKIEAMAIHGGLSQAQRNNTIARFNSKDTFVLVCTDVAARGLDIPGVSHVYNFDLPLDAKQYIHRIGRTARAGKSGKVVNLVCDRDHESFGKILREFDVKIEKVEKPQFEKIEMVGMSQGGGQSFGARGGQGGRTSQGNRGGQSQGHYGARDSARSSSPRSSSGGSNAPRRYGSNDESPRENRGYSGSGRSSGTSNFSGTSRSSSPSRGNSSYGERPISDRPPRRFSSGGGRSGGNRGPSRGSGGRR
ncbi:MAG: DEAD/DEAH box helicase [Candidatus Woesearchaeota archaeon]|jgi:ATP-dependent RNA helicase DeaD